MAQVHPPGPSATPIDVLQSVVVKRGKPDKHAPFWSPYTGGYYNAFEMPWRVGSKTVAADGHMLVWCEHKLPNADWANLSRALPPVESWITTERINEHRSGKPHKIVALGRCGSGFEVFDGYAVSPYIAELLISHRATVWKGVQDGKFVCYFELPCGVRGITIVSPVSAVRAVSQLEGKTALVTARGVSKRPGRFTLKT